MNVVWAATALKTGWFSGIERHSNVQDLEAHIKALGTGLGQGYLEIRRPDGDLPYLALGFKGDHAVLHLFDNSGGVSLRVGDDSAAPSTEVEVVIMDELYAFTADVALSMDHAWDIVHDFIQTGAPGELSDWYEL
ncbi:hypothetical protein [Streptomyces canus]|uniref:hypothetical protein n=1 Tax=Streptomyces canus TaxID=58343 RepID=UPI002E28700F|nr:hypothetical protein [Streptomyces canus]